MRKMESFFRRYAVPSLLATASAFYPSQAFADASTANLSIKITDPSGALIPGAHLVLRNIDTNQEQIANSGRSGSATFAFLKPGRYSLTVSKDSFADVVVEHIGLNIGDDRRLQLLLRVGSTAQSVNVDGSGLTINTTDGSVSTVVDHTFVENLPLNGRSFQDLISMTPGVVTQSPQTSSSVGSRGDFSVNGQRTESNYYTVDGVSANSGTGFPTGSAQNATGGNLPASTVLGTTQSLLSVDAMQEFRLESSTYSAEFGRTPGGQIALLSRSGTAVLHGSAYHFLRNNYFDANDWFSNHYGKPSAALRQNDFGGTLGGPIPLLGSKNRPTFFFVSYEGLRLALPQPASLQYVPDAAIRQTAARDIRPLLNAFPQPTSGGTDYGALAQFISTYSVPGHIDATSVRVDKTITARIVAFFRFADSPSSTQSRNLSSLQTISGNSKNYTAGATASVTSSLTDEVRFGYMSNESSLGSHVDGFGGAQPINLRTAMGLLNPDGAYATLYLSFAGTGVSYLQENSAKNSGSQWNLVNTLSANGGFHHWKLGLDLRRISSPLSPPSPYIFSQISSLASLRNNSATIQVQKSLKATPQFTEFAAYLADEWKVSPRFSLSLGLRWELNPPPTNANGENPYTLLGSTADPKNLTLAPQGTPLWRTTHYNFAPRLGGAWQVQSKTGFETVVRAGAGVFFDTDNVVAAGGFGGLGFVSYATYTASSFPITPAQQAFSVTATPPYTTASVYAFPSHLQLPYTLQWNTSLEQSLGKSQTLTLSYIGANGRRLLQSQTLYLTALNPQFGYVYFFPTGVTSNYQALQVKAQRSIRSGLNALLSYSWSHSIDFGSTSSALPLTRGNSDFDVRSNLQAGLSWNIPTPRGAGFFHKTLMGLGLDGRWMTRTGFPITIAGNSLVSPATGYYSTNVNLVPGQPIYLENAQFPGGRSVNRAAFSLPTGNDLGNAPRNFVRGFGATQLNVAVRKDFHLFESTSLEFRAEAFNVLNHSVFGLIDARLADATFGQATKTLSQSLGTVNALYQQGGPRSMQFALKLKF
jgi:hypothetical protein